MRVDKWRGNDSLLCSEMGKNGVFADSRITGRICWMGSAGSIRTTNLQEPLSEEIRRRERVIRVFPNDEFVFPMIAPAG